ncbi:MAG: hypothetical protein IJY80_04095, partial [Opitutales bacterium]|nr:hypothetical protein [Opitutales bacterium]
MFQKIRCCLSVLSFLCVAAFSAFAACEVIPLPQKYEEKKSFVPAIGLDKRVSVTRVKSLDGVPAHAQNEAYAMVVSKNGVKIKAVSDAGESNARKTLAQLIKNAGAKGVSVCKILDWPAYPMR